VEGKVLPSTECFLLKNRTVQYRQHKLHNTLQYTDYSKNNIIPCRKYNSNPLKYGICMSNKSQHRHYTTGLTHVDSEGKASMVNVGGKDDTVRRAVAEGSIFIGEEAFKMVEENKIKKGDVLTVSQIAGIMGAKATSSLIPLCHPLLLNNISLDLTMDEDNLAVKVRASVECRGKTGVEMEALTAVTVSLLTVYDMCKAVTKDMVIKDVRLVTKTGGKSDYGDTA